MRRPGNLPAVFATMVFGIVRSRMTSKAGRNDCVLRLRIVQWRPVDARRYFFVQSPPRGL